MAFVHAVACLACSAIGEVEGPSARFNNSFERFKVCGECGSRQGWRDATVRWVSAGVWFNPLTWGLGQWVEKIGD